MEVCLQYGIDTMNNEREEAIRWSMKMWQHADIYIFLAATVCYSMKLIPIVSISLFIDK